MEPKQKECKHTAWAKCILPWGNCHDCGVSVEEYMHDLLRRVCEALPDGELKDEIKRVGGK